jgi:hypothetical protein
MTDIMESVAGIPSPDSESRRLELQEAIATFRHQTALGTQAAGIILTADSLLIAYGFAQRVSGILLIASLMPLLVQAVSVVLLDASLPFIYTALVLEQELGLKTAPLVGIFTRKLLKPVNSVVADCDDLSDSAVCDAVLGIPWRAWLRGRTAMAYYCAFGAQFLLFVVSLAIYDYRFM